MGEARQCPRTVCGVHGRVSFPHPRGGVRIPSAAGIWSFPEGQVGTGNPGERARAGGGQCAAPGTGGDPLYRTAPRSRPRGPGHLRARRAGGRTGPSARRGRSPLALRLGPPASDAPDSPLSELLGRERRPGARSPAAAGSGSRPRREASGLGRARLRDFSPDQRPDWPPTNAASQWEREPPRRHRSPGKSAGLCRGRGDGARAHGPATGRSQGAREPRAGRAGRAPGELEGSAVPRPSWASVRDAEAGTPGPPPARDPRRRGLCGGVRPARRRH